MPSSKGEPTDPDLREKVKEEVKGESKGTSHAIPIYTLPRWGRQLVSVEGRGDGEAVRGCWGDYRDTGENRNEAKKGAPVKKGDK
ncbi:hypothetical protein LTR87_007879 [Friedmanniomyces endolithicus]|nr:hypothetical protein LTR87_007879 [Friedmanniomyces endolithicus]